MTDVEHSTYCFAFKDSGVDHARRVAFQLVCLFEMFARKLFESDAGFKFVAIDIAFQIRTWIVKFDFFFSVGIYDAIRRLDTFDAVETRGPFR